MGLRDLKGDLAIRPIYHQRQDRIEAPIFIAFIAYRLQVTLTNQLRKNGTGPELSKCLGEVRGADDRRGSPDHRRSRSGAHPLHREVPSYEKYSLPGKHSTIR
jgi:hypothetical protein